MIPLRPFVEVCESKIARIVKNVAGRDIYIWGIGQNAPVVLSVLKQYDIPIKGFTDCRAGQVDGFLGYPVRSILEMNPKKEYLILSMVEFDYSIYFTLDKLGYTSDDCFYVCENEGFIREDIVYKGCKVGRYTYGYKELLNNAPLAESIGRFCSINGTAKIWDNHSLDCVTTHPFLDRQEFLPWECFEKRKRFLSAYGKHWNNSKNENSPIRDNRPIEIGNDVWIGANAIILPGITIGDGAVVAAGAVVAKDVDSYSIVAGVPAKTIRYRFSDEEIRNLLKIRWWNWEIDDILRNLEAFYQPALFIQSFQ